MAERIILVCDVCGEAATDTVRFTVGGRGLAKDLCGLHLQELVRGAHAPRRGRRPGASDAPAPSRRSSPRPSARASSSRSRRTPRERRTITDPATLEKRRAALEKARQALAAKRAAAKQTS